MAAAKKKTPNIVQTKNTVHENVRFENLKAPGLKFRWVSPAFREKRGWDIWQPVRRDSDLGEQIAKQLGDVFDKFMGLQTDTNYFYMGADLMLAFASEEAHAEMAARKHAENRAPMLAVQGDDAIKTQDTQIALNGKNEEK